MRKHYIDNLRWFTVVLVVIYHVFFIYSVVVPDMGMPFSDVQYQDGIMYLLWPWFMILLFLVSGMSSRCMRTAAFASSICAAQGSSPT